MKHYHSNGDLSSMNPEKIKMVIAKASEEGNAKTFI